MRQAGPSMLACTGACMLAAKLTERSGKGLGSVLTQGASKQLIVIQMPAPLH